MKGKAMMKVHRLFILATTLSLLGTGAAMSQSTRSGDAAKGRETFLNVQCYTCHGRVGEGGRFMYAAPPLTGLDMPPEALQAFLRSAPNDMPSFAPSILTDDDIANIAAFLRSLPGRSDPKDFPLLNQ
jgi:mono/diheme cytochrome c family protein